MTSSNIRDLLDQHFNDDELRRLCFDLGIEYENLAGPTRIAKAQSLVAHCLRHGRLPELGARCQELRPKVSWPDLDALAADLAQMQQAAGTLTHTVADESLLADMLAPLRQKETALLAQLGVSAVTAGSGAVAQGAGAAAVGERGVHAGRARVIITGDNNSVQTIIHHYNSQPPDPAALRQQIAAYLTWLLDWAGTLELRGIQRHGEQVVQLPLEQVYVPLAAAVYRPRSGAKDEWSEGALVEEEAIEAAGQLQEITLADILSLQRRLILTGGPGCGKTTVLLHIAWALARALAADEASVAAAVGFPAAEPLPLPIFVPLNAYAAHRRSLGRRDDRTLAAFISHYLFARQTSFALPDDFFRHLLRQGQAVLLLLDGLDEVPDETERAQVRQDIEDLVTGREQMRVITTCRSAAYQGRTALGKGFRQVMVRPLAEDHIAALVEHAYAHLYRADPMQHQQKTAELLAGITRLETERRARLGRETPHLIDSPLLVRMLLIVHYRDRRLPEQRAELYMKATDAMLLPDYAPDTETADAIGQLIGGSWEVHRDLVQHLAFHMHQRGEKQGRNIEEPDLRRMLAAEPAYAPLVDAFVKLTRLRGTLLEERLGSYRFLHLAFQEYLAARYLAEIVRSEGGIEAVVAFLEAGPLLASWWREVVLLVAGYFGVASPQTAQSFLTRLAGIGQEMARPVLPAATQLAAAELAAVGWLEWPAQREALRRQLADRLAALFADTTVMSQAGVTLRAAAGRALAQLGDPRPGVGVDPVTGLPDIAWGAKEIPAGTYRLGDDQGSGSKKPRTVTIPRPYRLARYPITQAQFQSFIEAPDWDAAAWWDGLPPDEQQFSEPYNPYTNHPRERVSWYQAIAFCRWLTARLHAGELRSEALTGDLKQYVITLPHEVEWEVAARWPNETMAERIYPWGNAWDEAKANTKEGGLGQTSAVGLYPAGRNSALELYDLSGNVWEWCRSRYDQPGRDMDTDKVDISGTRRVLRGGSWNSDRHDARAASRGSLYPDLRGPRRLSVALGFRVVGVRRPPS